MCEWDCAAADLPPPSSFLNRIRFLALSFDIQRSEDTGNCSKPVSIQSVSSSRSAAGASHAPLDVNTERKTKRRHRDLNPQFSE